MVLQCLLPVRCARAALQFCSVAGLQRSMPAGLQASRVASTVAWQGSIPNASKRLELDTMSGTGLR